MNKFSAHTGGFIINLKVTSILILFSLIKLEGYCQQHGYQNFKVAVYSRSYEVKKMGDLKWIEPIWDEITGQVHVDKIYLETHRDLVIVPEDTLMMVKRFFEDRGIETAGGITLTVNESNRFETFCYSNPEHREKVREVVEYTASHFDELILDDFFFTSCKCELCIAAKGDRSWTDYRLELMDDAARNLIIGPAKKINPDIKVVVKYPNWYEHFQGLGFNLETEPPLFDGLYTGTETRDAVMSDQHLQPYLGYNIFRYFENLKPGGNGGGWVDTGGAINLDRYAEQLWITLFAKAPEITLFDFRQLQINLSQFQRASWQGQHTSFDLDKMMTPIQTSGNKTIEPTTIARAAGYTFEIVDPILDDLGEPVGLKCYKPFHSVGEDFLHNYLGMIGIPIDMVSEFPAEAPMILLTESAKYDPEIISKIKNQLMEGKSVVITSGFLKATQGKGIEDIVELRYTDRKALVNTFKFGWFNIEKTEKNILIPQINYLTNDSWELISALDGPNGWPVLHDADYANGHLYVLTIPENFADLYELPEGILNRLRQTMLKSQEILLEAPGNISIFTYDNGTFIVESFMDETVEAKVTSDTRFNSIRDFQSGEKISGEKREAPRFGFGSSTSTDKMIFSIEVKPHSFRAFKLNE